MKKLNEFQVSEKAQTISEIAGVNLDTTGFDFLSKPFCHFILKVETGCYIKYEADSTLIESLKNGYHFVTIYEGDDYVDFAERVKTDKIVEL